MFSRVSSGLKIPAFYAQQSVYLRRVLEVSSHYDLPLLGTKSLSHCPRSGGREQWAAFVGVIPLLYKQGSCEDGSLWFSQFSTTSIKSLPHEQAGARTIFLIGKTPLFSLALALCTASTLWVTAEWKKGALYLLAAFIWSWGSARQKLGGWEILVASFWGDSIVSDAHLGWDKAPSSWPHLTRAELWENREQVVGQMPQVLIVLTGT